MAIGWRRKLVFAGMPLLLSVLAAEAGLRIWMRFCDDETRARYALLTETPEAVRFRPHHYLSYSLQPGYIRGETRHNSLGYRGEEIAVPKPLGIFRIAILGGSTTYTEFVKDDAKTFPALVQTMLRERRGDRRIEVVNAGVPGYNSWESLGNLAFRVLDLQPDLVIVHHGVNDAHCRFVPSDRYAGDNGGRRSIWAEPVDVRLLRYSLLTRVLGRHAGLWSHPGVEAFVRAPTSEAGSRADSLAEPPMELLDKNPPIYFARNLRNMAAIARANGSEILLTTWAHTPHRGDYAASPHYRRAFAEGNETVEATAREIGAPFFDFAREMSQDPRFWRDGRHVNEAGAELKARLFADFLLASGLLEGTEFTTPSAPSHSPKAN